MRISERGQITIPKPLRDRFGMNPNVEGEMMPTEQGLLIRKRPAAEHPVDRVCAILGGRGNTDDYIEEIRGRKRFCESQVGGITGSDVVTKRPNA